MKQLSGQRLGLTSDGTGAAVAPSAVIEGEQIATNEDVIVPADGSRPKVFLSHATADKERFVNALDVALRARGMEVWLDERDLIPGRNLVDEIFTHGISKSDVFVVVLSDSSINRPWVHEELSVAVVQRIDGAVKVIIPVVLDGVTPPASLSATVQIRVRDIMDVEGVANRIGGAVFGVVPAPVAAAPAYAGIPVHRLSGLEPDDERIFAFACESLLANPMSYPYVQLHDVASRAEALGMPRELIVESIAVLAQHGMFSDVRHYGEDGQIPSAAKVPTYSFERYLLAYRPSEYRDEKLRIISAIVNDDASYSRGISQQLGIHEYIVDHVFEQLESAGHVMASHSMDGIHIRANATLRRVMRDMEGERS
jgi:hypothetical protein